jgi:hypothetical protein
VIQINLNTFPCHVASSEQKDTLTAVPKLGVKNIDIGFVSQNHCNVVNWLKRNKYPNVFLRSLKLVVPFTSSYLCEAGFSSAGSDSSDEVCTVDYAPWPCESPTRPASTCIKHIHIISAGELRHKFAIDCHSSTLKICVCELRR